MTEWSIVLGCKPSSLIDSLVRIQLFPKNIYFILKIYSPYLKEVRYRSLYLLLSFLFALACAYRERESLLFLILEPLNRNIKEGSICSWSFLGPTEAFGAQIYLSLATAFLSLAPLIWLQMWFFLANSLYHKEQKTFRRLSLISLLFLFSSLHWTKEFLLPRIWVFFLSFSTFSSEEALSYELTYLPSLLPYLDLSLEVYIALLLSSQLPIFFFLLVHWKWLSRDLILWGRPWIILILLIWGALLSPPDLGSQLLIFVPLFVTYEFLVFSLLLQQEILTHP